MARETIFDGMEITVEQCRDGLHNFFESVLCGFNVEEPRFEKTVNHISTYMLRTLERTVDMV